MSTRFIQGVGPLTGEASTEVTRLKNETTDRACPFVYDIFGGIVKYYDRVNSAIRTLVTLDGTESLTNKTLVAPVITGQASGVVKVAGGVITELTGDAAYSISVVLPAGATLIDIQVTGQALWTAVTSATLKVGDAVDDDGYITACDVKSAPAVGATFSLFSEAAMGTVDGAYLNTDSIVGPTATNFGLFFVAGTTIKATVTKVGAGTAGRTAFFVIYSVPEAVAQVVA